MAPSSTLVAAPRRAHDLSSMKSPIFSNSLSLNSHRRSTSGSTPTKRPLVNDENADHAGLSNSKRVKSTIQSSVLISKSINEHPKQSTTSSSSSDKQQQGRFILTDKQPLPQQKRGALGNITNTHHRVEKSSSKPRIGSLLKNVLSNTSPPRRNRPSPPRTTRDVKRVQHPPFAVRIDPPVFDSVPLSSINSALQDTPMRSRSNSLLTPSSDVAPSPAVDTLAAPSIPDSWVFAIYEDTPEETLQNIMEHSTHTLDLSDDESSKSELSELGKENIPPSRLAELMATAPEERADQMRVDVAEKNIPQRKPAAMVFGEQRAPLREMESPELENEEVKEEVREAKIPTLDKEEFMTVTTPEKKAPIVPKGKGALGWTVWSDCEAKLKDQNELPQLPPVDNARLKGLGIKAGKLGGLRRKGSEGKKRTLSD